MENYFSIIPFTPSYLEHCKENKRRRPQRECSVYALQEGSDCCPAYLCYGCIFLTRNELDELNLVSKDL